MRRMITGDQIAKLDNLKPVEANPRGVPSGTLSKIEINDVVYNIKGLDSKTWDLTLGDTYTFSFGPMFTDPNPTWANNRIDGDSLDPNERNMFNIINDMYRNFEKTEWIKIRVPFTWGELTSYKSITFMPTSEPVRIWREDLSDVIYYTFSGYNTEGKFLTLRVYVGELSRVAYVGAIYGDNAEQKLIKNLVQSGNTLMARYTDSSISEVYSVNIPTKTSDLTNDSDFTTSASVDTKLEDYALKTEIPTVPTDVSAFNNDAGYITDSYHDSTKQDSLSTAQLNAANSGITAAKVTKYDNYDSKIPTDYLVNATATDNILYISKSNGEVVSFQGGGGSTGDALQYSVAIDWANSKIEVTKASAINGHGLFLGEKLNITIYGQQPAEFVIPAGTMSPYIMDISTANTIPGWHVEVLSRITSTDTVVYETEIANKNYVNPTYAKTTDIPDVSGKLDKVTTTGTYARLYGVNSGGVQTVYNMTSGNIASTVASRNANGQINVADPTSDAHAANKRYVDKADATKQDIITDLDTIRSGAAKGDTSVQLTGDQTITGATTIKGTLNVARSDGSTGVRIYNNQTGQIGIAGWKAVGENNVRTWYAFPLGDVAKSYTVATTSDIPDVSGKLDKVTTAPIANYYKLYAVNSSGEQITVDGSYQRVASGVVLRDSDKQINVPETPTLDTHAASKKYVDDLKDTFVTTDTNQNITGIKTFDTFIQINENNNELQLSPSLIARRENGATFYNNYWPEESGTLATLNDIYYKNNDTFTNVGYFITNGYITGSQKQIAFMIQTPKSIKNISTITVNNLRLLFRGVSGYVNGSSYVDYANTTGYTVSATKASDNMIYVQIFASNAYSSATNNTPISAVGQASSINLTFNT